MLDKIDYLKATKEPQAVKVNEEFEYFTAGIMGKRTLEIAGKTEVEYLVRWYNYDHTCWTWQGESDVHKNKDVLLWENSFGKHKTPCFKNDFGISEKLLREIFLEK